MLFNTVALGVTVRVNDNRFQEGFTMTAYSLLSLGYLNTAATNQATHCLFVLGHRTQAPSNIIATDLDGKNCERRHLLLSNEYEYTATSAVYNSQTPGTDQ